MTQRIGTKIDLTLSTIDDVLWEHSDAKENTMGHRSSGVSKMSREPDVSLRVWINAEGIRAEVVHCHEGQGYDHEFNRTYDKPGQVAAIWESFRQGLLEFIDDFRKKR